MCSFTLLRVGHVPIQHAISLCYHKQVPVQMSLCQCVIQDRHTTWYVDMQLYQHTHLSVHMSELTYNVCVEHTAHVQHSVLHACGRIIDVNACGHALVCVGILFVDEHRKQGVLS